LVKGERAIMPKRLPPAHEQALTKHSTLPDIEAILAGQLTASSIAMYKRDIAAYTVYAEAAGKDPLSPLTLVAWRDSLALSGQMSPNTINRMLAAVKRLAREMAARELLEETTALKFHQIKGVQVRALKHRLKQQSRTRIEPEDMRRLCSAPDTTTLIGLRDAALLATLASSGVRASELASLTQEQVKRRGRGYYLLVRGKTDTEFREAHLSAEAYGLINTWISQRPVLSHFVFTSFSTRGVMPSPEPISEVTVWTIVKRYSLQCGLEHVKPHDLRRFVGTQLAAKDIRKAQKALGHRSIEVTARHYVLDELEIGLTDHLY
jgi:integrase/recombinase XerD